jgi:hypothetical protein
MATPQNPYVPPAPYQSPPQNGPAFIPPPIQGAPRPPLGARASRKTVWIIGGAALVTGIILGAAAGVGGSNTKAIAAPGITTTTTATTTVSETMTATVQVTTTPTKVVATRIRTVRVTYTPPAPKSFGEGTYVVGTDIQPGLYKTAGGSGICYWARLSSLNTSDIIDNSNSVGLQTVQVMASDRAFEVSGDCVFARTG